VFDLCRLRGVWQSVRQRPLLPSSPSARLGTIVHRLLEEAGRGAFPAARASEAIEARWNELVSEANAAMGRNPFERRFVPLDQSVAKFEVVRLRAVARAAELAADTPGAGARAGDASATPFGYELRVESGDGLIAGRIDRAIPALDGVVLQDYKSGAIFTLRHGEERALKPEYAIQLQLYAALYHDATGTWPSRLELVPLSGSPHAVPFVQAESLRLLEDARALLAEVNQQLARSSHDWEGAERSLASPSPSACRFCSYRPACLPYLERNWPDPDNDWPADVWGQFGGLQRLGNGSLILTLKRGDSVFFVRGISDAQVEETGADSVTEAADVGVFNARRTRSPQAFEAGPLTAIRTRASA
jgi:hypothetical protein